MSSFVLVFLLLIGMVIYLVRSATATEEEKAPVQDYITSPPTVEKIAPNLNKARTVKTLSPGWYPSATGEAETYFDGTAWGESRPRSEAAVAVPEVRLADDRLNPEEDSEADETS